MDGNDDDWVCLKQGWGEDLNPNAHWYRVGIEIIGSPTVSSTIWDNVRNGTH